MASRASGGAPFVQFSVGQSSSTSVTAQDGVYYVRVLATVAGIPVASNEILVIVGAGGAPTEPQELEATVAGNVVTLTWAPPINEAIVQVRSYYVAAGSAPGISNLAFFPTGSAVTTYVTGAVPNGSYWVRIYAESTGGLSPPSAEVRVVVGPPPPQAPVLSGGSTGPGSVLLQWTAAPAPGAPVTGYQLQAGYQPGQSNAAVIALPAAPLSYAAAGIPPGTYYVRVVPLSSAGPGTASNEVVVTVP
ncbi:MAG: fibronectin type III domain-containing protein [Vicinamibacterales bacterium]